MAYSLTLLQERVARFRSFLATDHVGFFLLLSFLFVVPLSQFLMNLVLVVLVAWWLSTGNITHDLRACPLYVKSFLLFSIFPIITVFTSDLAEMDALIARMPGMIKFGIVLLPLYTLARTKGGDSRSTVWLMTALAAGGIVASIAALISWESTSHLYPVLPNTGGANHASVYMILVATVAIAAAFTGTVTLVAWCWVALSVSLLVLFLLQSFNAYAAMVCVSASGICISIIMRRYAVMVLICALPLILVAIAVMAPDADRRWIGMEKEFNQKIHGDDQSRIQILRAALEVFDHHLWFGAGPDQFESATSEARIRAELQAEGRNYDMEKDDFLHLSDGHSVWIHVLVERGLVGIGLLVMFFVLSGVVIVRSAVRVLFHETGDPILAQLVFLSTAVWMALFVGGIATTTLHFEHGLVGSAVLVWSTTALEQQLRGASDDHGRLRAHGLHRSPNPSIC